MRGTSRRPILSERRHAGALLTRDQGEHGAVGVGRVVEADVQVREADVTQGPEQVLARQPA